MSLPPRSACTCPCHQGGMMHAFPCCHPESHGADGTHRGQTIITEIEDKFAELMRQPPRPAKIYVSETALDALNSAAACHQEPSQPQGVLGRPAAVPVFRADVLPDGMHALFVDKNGLPIGIVVDETFRPTRRPEGEAV